MAPLVCKRFPHPDARFLKSLESLSPLDEPSLPILKEILPKPLVRVEVRTAAGLWKTVLTTTSIRPVTVEVVVSTLRFDLKPPHMTHIKESVLIRQVSLRYLLLPEVALGPSWLTLRFSLSFGDRP